MITVTPVKLKGGIAIGTTLDLPKTRVVTLSTQKGYVMCGVLNVPLLDEMHPDRKIIAACVVGVKTIDDLLSGKIIETTKEAERIGITVGMTGKEGLEKMLLE